jgi:hypothetical protein
MDTKPATSRRVSLSHEEQIFRLQLRVARRADELARKSPSGGSATRDRETWHRAEGELLGDWAGQATRAFRRVMAGK